MLWIQRDPLGRIPGSNEYAYCLGEPVDRFDPYGLWDWDNDWVETLVDLVSPTAQGDAARKGFAEGYVDGAVMATDNLTFGKIDSVHEEAERIREKHKGEWTYEVGDGASVVGRNALLAAGEIAAGSMLMATPAGAALGQAILQSPTAVMALQGMAALGAAGGGFSVGTGIYNISTGNYKEGTVQIGNGAIVLLTAFSGAKAQGTAGRATPNAGGCPNQPAGNATVPAGPANGYNILTANMSAAERQAAIEYARRTNAWIKANGGSTTVQSTAGALRSQASAAARLERLHAARNGMPYNGQAGHVPDTALTGMPNPPAGWLDMPGRSNNIIGGGLSSRIGQRVDGITVDGALP